MEPEGFNGKAGSVAMSSRGTYYTFTPRELPVGVGFDDELKNLLPNAAHGLGTLEGLGHLLKNPHLFIKPYLKKEAVLSSKIEGTQSSLSDVFLFEAKDGIPKEPTEQEADINEVMNYIRALEYGLLQIRSRELDLELILELHKILLTGVRGADKEPGQIRIRQNWIGKRGVDITQATYVPPEAEKVEPLLKNLLDYLNNAPQEHPLIKIGLAHYQFEAIHPFRDGNGRMGRLLITLYLIKKKMLSLPLLYLSAYFERNRDTYYDLLLQVSQKGDYETWLKFFLKGVILQSEDVIIRSKKMVTYSDECAQKVKRTKNTYSLMILDNLFVNPYITVPHASAIIGKRYPTTNRALENLVKLGIVKETTGKKRNRVFLAEEIIKILQEDKEQIRGNTNEVD